MNAGLVALFRRSFDQPTALSCNRLFLLEHFLEANFALKSIHPSANMGSL